MKTCYLDANVLFCLQDSQSLFHQIAKSVVEKLIEEDYKLAISSLCLDEYLHTSLRFSGKSKQEMASSLRSSLRKIFTLPGLMFVNPPVEKKKHIKVVGLVTKHNLKPRDAYHLFIIRENRIKYFATFDADFDEVFKKGWLKKISSLSPQ